ncbi:hypothetical protein Scep_024658 [Stephania cephalantha]|uniref:pectinesterase n=1 Tax=Stephania cephalantha TaxID=152367 RepID=A0AAP0F492_9MAGN
MTNMAGQAALLVTILVLLIVQLVPRIDAALDPALVVAEKSVKVIKVRKDGSGDFKTNSAPKPDGKRLNGEQAVAMRISGDKAAFYNSQGSELHSIAEGESAITAQGKEQAGDDGGFAFVHCKITGTGNTYLGRAWKERAKVVFAYTYMGTLVNPEGWSDKGFTSRDK